MNDDEKIIDVLNTSHFERQLDVIRMATPKELMGNTYVRELVLHVNFLISNESLKEKIEEFMVHLRG